MSANCMSRITNLKSYLFILNKNGVRNYYFTNALAILKNGHHSSFRFRSKGNQTCGTAIKSKTKKNIY